MVLYRLQLQGAGIDGDCSQTLHQAVVEGTGKPLHLLFPADERNGTDMNNGSSELYAGPAMNFILPKYNLWMGIGAYFPVYRDADSPAPFEDYRIDFKLGKLWSF